MRSYSWINNFQTLLDIVEIIMRYSDLPDYCSQEESLFYNRTVFYDETAEIRRIAYQIIAPIIVVIGILGNVMNLLVLITKPFLKGGTRIYLTALALSDLTVMITVIPMVIRWNRLEWKTYEAAFYHAHIELFLNNTFIASSVFIVVCLTIERYFSVCLPTMFKSIHTMRIARYAVLGCYLTALFVSIPLTNLKSVCRIPNGAKECPEYDFHENKSITNTIYWSIYLWVSESFVRFGPSAILANLNILIIRKFRQITARRKTFREALAGAKSKIHCRQYFDSISDAKFKKALRNKKYQEEKRLIILLRAIVVLFFITMTPSAILSLLYKEMHEGVYSFQIFRAAANNLELANFGLNFYVYYFCSKEFRNALMQLCTICLSCDEELIDNDIESAKIDDNILKVIKLSDTSECNSTADKFSIDF